MKNNFSCYINQKTPRVAITYSLKLNFRKQKIIRGKGKHYTRKRGHFSDTIL